MTTQPSADTPAQLSGFQFRIHSNEHEATITDVGAKVRSYAVGGRNVFTPFGADGVAAHLGTDIGDRGLVLTGVDPELEPGERGWGVGRGLGHPGRLAPCLFTRRRSGR